MPITWPFRRTADPSLLAQQHGEEAVALLAEAMGDDKFGPQNRVRAALALLDRGWGRPRMALEKTPSPLGSLSDAELAAAIDWLRAAGVTSGQAGAPESVPDDEDDDEPPAPDAGAAPGA